MTKFSPLIGPMHSGVEAAEPLSYKILPHLATNVSPGCWVDIYKLELQTKDPEYLHEEGPY